MTPYYPPCYALVSGGKDSLSTAQVLADADRLEGCVALGTGVSTPEWREFLIKICKQRGWPLEFHHTTASGRAIMKHINAVVGAPTGGDK